MYLLEQELFDSVEGKNKVYWITIGSNISVFFFFFLVFDARTIRPIFVIVQMFVVRKNASRSKSLYAGRELRSVLRCF